MPKKRGKKLKFALGLALAVSAGSIALLPSPEVAIKDSPIQTRKIFDGNKLRKAWIDSDCASADTSDCERAWDRRGYCVCLTTVDPPLVNEIEKGNIPVPARWKLRVCEHRDNPNDIIVRIQNPEDGIPKDYLCSTVASGFTSNNSIPSYKSSLDEAVEAACGFEVSGGSWPACCPRCVRFQNGCPPCPELCQYGNEWPGHESECNPEP